MFAMMTRKHGGGEVHEEVTPVEVHEEVVVELVRDVTPPAVDKGKGVDEIVVDKGKGLIRLKLRCIPKGIVTRLKLLCRRR
ncbi:unnamed protein product [Amaranthus hypochondriacus]